MHVLIRISSHRTLGTVCFFGNDRSSQSRIRINLDPMRVYYEWGSEWVTNLHIVVPAITRGTLVRPHELKIKGWLQNKQTISTRLLAKRYKFENNRRIGSKLPSANLQVTCAPASCSLAPQNPSQLHNNRSLINKHCWPLRFDMTANYQV